MHHPRPHELDPTGVAAGPAPLPVAAEAVDGHIGAWLDEREVVVPEADLPIAAECGKISGMQLTKARLEAFSDGVIAIILTLMILEFKVPEIATGAPAIR